MKNKVITILLSFYLLNVAYASPNIVEQRLKALSETSPFEINDTKAKRTGIYDNFYNDHSILFIYSSRCQYCHHFAPIFKHWLDGRGLSVRAISLDNKAIDLFPTIEQKDDTLVNSAYGDMPHGTPAVFIVNEQTKAIYPAAYGNLSSQELDFRMVNLVAKIKEFERRA